jgi:hypothetical protein
MFSSLPHPTPIISLLFKKSGRDTILPCYIVHPQRPEPNTKLEAKTRVMVYCVASKQTGYIRKEATMQEWNESGTRIRMRVSNKRKCRVRVLWKEAFQFPVHEFRNRSRSRR